MGLVAIVWLGGALCACDDAPSQPQASPEERPASQDSTGSVEARPTGPAEACARELAEHTPLAVRATLDDLGYDVLFQDACLGQRAERDGDLALCEGLSVSTLRDRCATRVAVRHGRPMDCPSAHTLEGRDPLCVALAARDRRLCAAAGVVDRAICEGALGRERACARLPEEAREACTARATDLATRIEGEVRTTPAIETSCVLTLADGTTRPIASADRGVRLVYRACVRTLVLGDSARLTAPFAPAAIAMELAVPDALAGEVSLATAPDGLSSTLAATIDGTRALHASGGIVTIARLEPELGGVVEGTFHATFAGTATVLDGTFTTFVRDLDVAPAACAEPR